MGQWTTTLQKLLADGKQTLKGMMNSICSWLELTMENEEMFGGVLPTLDSGLSDMNRIIFSFYEKEMVSPMVLHKRSAMPRDG